MSKFHIINQNAIYHDRWQLEIVAENKNNVDNCYCCISTTKFLLKHLVLLPLFNGGGRR
jgi:hypothetical protein